MLRGLERGAIFRDDRERADFRDRLAALALELPIAQAARALNVSPLVVRDYFARGLQFLKARGLPAVVSVAAAKG